jgi:transposase
VRRNACPGASWGMSEPKSMRKVREILRLRYECHHNFRAIARSVGSSSSTVQAYVKRAREVQLATWEAVAALGEEELEVLLFPSGRGGEAKGGRQARAPIDCGYLHMELRRVGVTLLQLWREYVEAASVRADGLKPCGYTQFCERYGAFRKTLRRSMRQVHPAGERAFVDYSGKRPCIVDPATGEVREVELFVMVMGASQFTYAEASMSQKLPDFCSSLMRGLDYFGGAPQVLVPDQLRSAVRGPDRYDPDINRTLMELSAHYRMTVLPARPRKPKDKAKVENAVLIVQRWVLARLRNETFMSLAALNRRIAELMEVLNSAPFQKLDGTRRSLFTSFDKPALQALPQEPFDLGVWKRARVHIDYHVALFDRFYSVPCAYVGADVELRYTPSLVEVYVEHARIASHPRSYEARGSVTTEAAHMPQAHREMGKWTQERMLDWAATHGESVRKAIERLFASYPRPEFGFRAALGVIRLADQYGASALDRACAHALTLGTLPPRRRLLLALLAPNTRVRESVHERSSRSLGAHEHVRGSDYFDFDRNQTPDKDTVH